MIIVMLQIAHLGMSGKCGQPAANERFQLCQHVASNLNAHSKTKILFATGMRIIKDVTAAACITPWAKRL